MNKAPAAHLSLPQRVRRRRGVALLARRVVRVVSGVARRARRGFAPSDAWNAGWYLSAVTAGLLERLADDGYGWPSARYRDFDEWSAALRKAAAALQLWAGDDFDTDADEHQALGAAQEALHWVAENLADLWD